MECDCSANSKGAGVTSWAEVRNGLKPFQVATTEAAFHGLWHEDTTSRFLVADEVGLGKTLVAKGVIAKTIEHLQSLGDKRIDIVYICSNSSIARQNLLKLKEFADGHEESADRLTKLIAAKGLRDRGVNVIALTPGTSFAFGHRSGQFDERALLYAVIRKVWPDGAEVLAFHGGKRIFYYGIGEDDRSVARARLVSKAREFDERLNPLGIKIVRGLIQDRNRELRELGAPTIWAQLRALAPAFGRQGELWNDEWEQRQAVLGELRQILAQAGVNLLRPDLVIMDEFQRFADLLDPTSTAKAAQLLRTFITGEHSHNSAPTKVLLLSATPYRWFDQSGHGSHHSDFLSTLSFLHAGDPAPVEAAEQALGQFRAALLAGEDQNATAIDAAAAASRELRRVMVRTERLSSTPDRNGMLREVHSPTPLDQRDIEGFLAAQALSDRLASPGVIELWKTSPWIANLGDGYRLTERLLGRASSGEFKWDDPTLLDIQSVASFTPIDVPSPRLRWLINRTVGQGWHRLLWIPASRPYYGTDNEFDRAVTSGITKQLIFSSWRIAPKAIAVGVTYAAEQDIYKVITSPVVGSDEWSDTAYRSQERTLLDLRLTPEGLADSASTFLLTAPFSGLAEAIDPAVLGQRSDGTLRPLAEVRSLAASILTDRLRALGIAAEGATRHVDWYVYAARMLSGADDPWWNTAKSAAFAGSDDQDRRALAAHIKAFTDPVRPDGPPPNDLVEVLVDLALASPAVCALRALSRTLDAPSLSEPELLGAAARIGWGFRSLLDTSEVIQIVESDRPYWQAVLEYAEKGNLQAVLDEYVHMLREWKLGGRRGSDAAAELASAAVDALAFRTVTLDVRVPAADGVGVAVRKMRSRFAVRFGDKSSDDDGDRKDVTSAAFNSPFWPFVMATTSIGQEGLDFHLYCHALVHWNLPSDPVALEQREGRVHRFKGHAVRKNVAQASASVVEAIPSEDLWDAMFDHVTDPQEADGIKPFWIFEGDATVDRIVPMLPMSREHSDLERLKGAAVTYRMAFGQPRHGDLLEIIDGRSDLPAIDLAPTTA